MSLGRELDTRANKGIDGAAVTLELDLALLHRVQQRAPAKEHGSEAVGVGLDPREEP